MIRRAEPGDLAAVLAIAAEGFDKADDRPTAGWLVRMLARPGVRLRVDAPGPGVVRGFLLTEEYTAGDFAGGVVVRIIAVGPRFQRQGVGRGLLGTFEGPASAWVRRENFASQSLFASLGFYAYAAPHDRPGEWILMTR